MLIHFGVTPYLVFDGDNLPSKAYTETERAKKRGESKRRGLELYKASKVSQAYPEFQKSVDVTPYMARQLIEELKRLNIQYVVAPYEADAQLAYLEKKGIIDGILSEDSDLLVYGAKKLITKLDQHGDCIEISRSDFASCRDITLTSFTDAEFRLMAILSGCDYLASINKVGLKTAHTYVRKYKHVEKILRMLQFEQKFVVPPSYLERFYEAERTFLHHRVFCPLEKKLVFFTEPGDGLKEEEMPYLGKDVDSTIAIGVACGDLDPMTKKQILMNTASMTRSMPDLHRRQTIASATDLKPSKSIDNFFRPKRQPLAELDPNSLTPSPSQQRLLNLHRNASWEARPVSSAPQLRRSNSVLPGPSQVHSIEQSSFLQRAATLSTFQPTKRTRLCSDVDVSPSGKDGRSPFFAAEPEPSPSIRKRGKTKKARLSDIEIFSDDSIAEIFQDMPDDSLPSARPNQADSQGREPTNDKVVVATPVTKFRDSPIRQKIEIPQLSVLQTTSVISVSASDDAEEFQDLVEIHVKQLNNLRNTFAYQSPEKQTTLLRRLSPPNNVSQGIKQGESRAEKPSTRNRLLDASQPIPRPKQSQPKASLHKTFGTQTSHQQAAALKSLGQSQSSAHKVKLGLAALDSIGAVESQQRPLTPLQQLGQRALHRSSNPSFTGSDPSTVSLPVPDAAPEEVGVAIEKAVEVNFVGSEDLLVPNSEYEGSELSEVDGVESVRRNGDFSRFAFTANT